MPRRIENTTLNATTMDILNVIRQNASYEYQSMVPKVTQATDIPKVGEVIYGTPSFANQFINALVNRIAFVRLQSVTFNNPYAWLKKGYIEFGESIEDIFTGIAQAIPYSAEKAEEREHKRYLPDVKSVFYAMNWRVIYPVSIQNNDLKLAFLSINGVEDLIAKIIDQVYKGAEYDEFLLFKYLMIKGISHGEFYPKAVDKDNFVATSGEYRGISNLLLFPKTAYNRAGVLNNTPRERQVIFMDAMYNGKYDATALASAFNMDKISYQGQLVLIDDWATFDQKRFTVIQQESDMLPAVTTAELTLMKDVVAAIVDVNYFQVYDNENKFTEKYMASGLYWNYFYHVWKTVATSPYANAVVFVDDSVTINNPTSITVEIQSKSISEEGVVLNLVPDLDSVSIVGLNGNFVQTEQMTKDGIAFQSYGSILIPASATSKNILVVYNLNGVEYTAMTSPTTGTAQPDYITSTADVGDTLTLKPPTIV